MVFNSRSALSILEPFRRRTFSFFLVINGLRKGCRKMKVIVHGNRRSSAKIRRRDALISFRYDDRAPFRTTHFIELCNNQPPSFRSTRVFCIFVYVKSGRFNIHYIFFLRVRFAITFQTTIIYSSNYANNKGPYCWYSSRFFLN